MESLTNQFPNHLLLNTDKSFINNLTPERRALFDSSYWVMQWGYGRMHGVCMNKLSKICTNIWQNYLKSNLNLCNFLLKCWLMEMLQYLTWSHTLQDTLTVPLNQGQIFLAVFLISYEILKEKKKYIHPGQEQRREKFGKITRRYFLTVRPKGTRSKHHDKQTTQNAIWKKHRPHNFLLECRVLCPTRVLAICKKKDTDIYASLFDSFRECKLTHYSVI